MRDGLPERLAVGANDAGRAWGGWFGASCGKLSLELGEGGQFGQRVVAFDVGNVEETDAVIKAIGRVPETWRGKRLECGEHVFDQPRVFFSSLGVCLVANHDGWHTSTSSKAIGILRGIDINHTSLESSGRIACVIGGIPARTAVVSESRWTA